MSASITSQKGVAIIEFVFFFSIVGAILLVAVEGGNAIHSYSTIVEASREGARMALREGDTAGVQHLVESLTSELPNGPVSTNITLDPGAKTVTVEVGYEYQTIVFPDKDAFFAAISLPGTGTPGAGPIVLTARTTMPMP